MESLAQGDSDIGELASSHAYFEAVLELSAEVDAARDAVRVELDAVGLSVGLEKGAASTDIATVIDAKLGVNTEGPTKLNQGPHGCAAALAAVGDAAQACDAGAQGLAFSCSEPCPIDPVDEAACTGEIGCVGSMFACSGDCRGACELAAAATCDGRCLGQCDGTCTVLDQFADCAGWCDGMCEGTCELVNGECSGECQGTCAWSPVVASCEGDGTPTCAAEDGLCDGTCGGLPTVAPIAPECAAVATAAGPIAFDCDPTAMQFLWHWSASAEGDVEIQAEFSTWVSASEARLGKLAAEATRLEALAQAGNRLTQAGSGPVQSAMNAGGDTCALEALPEAQTMLADAGQAATSALAEVGELLAAFE